jgi:hypothetical protein
MHRAHDVTSWLLTQLLLVTEMYLKGHREPYHM